MNILFLTPQLPYPPRQGTTIRNFNLIRLLAAHHTVDLITMLAPGESLAPDNPLYALCRRVAVVPQPMRSTQQRARDTLLSGSPDMGLRLESQSMHDRVNTWIADGNYAIVQIEGIELAQYGHRGQGNLLPARIFDNHNCEYLLQQRNAFTDLKSPPRWVAAGYSLVQWQKLRRYESAAMRAADATTAVSEADRAALLELTPDADITVVSNGIDLDVYTVNPTPPPTNPPCLVFTGKMDYRPNIDAVLWFANDVLPLVVAQVPAVRFQIVGMNPHPRLDPLRSNPNIEITGAVDDTRPYIQAAVAYVIPMRVGGGTRFKALEAMACGKAIISTTLGIEGIPVTGGQEMLLADTPEAFAAAVLRLIADAKDSGALRTTLGATARHFVETHYGWQSIMPILEQVYTRVLERLIPRPPAPPP